MYSEIEYILIFKYLKPNHDSISLFRELFTGFSIEIGRKTLFLGFQWRELFSEVGILQQICENLRVGQKISKFFYFLAKFSHYWLKKFF